MRAGPKARAGLMHIELTGPSIHIKSGTMNPIARGPILPHPLHPHSQPPGLGKRCPETHLHARILQAPVSYCRCSCTPSLHLQFRGTGANAAMTHRMLLGSSRSHLLSSTTPDKNEMNRKDAYTSPMNACACILEMMQALFGH